MTQTRHDTTRQRNDTTTTDDAVLQVLPDALILVLCYQQVACPEMFSEEELMCIGWRGEEIKEKEMGTREFVIKKRRRGIFY
jgi:hypothetical protein